jgi:Fe2+ or Zn2+ uptake regulation protein
MEQFKTERTELTVQEILQDFAKENPNETTLVHKNGNNLEKLTELNMVIKLENGMKFIVYHNTPTTVS